MADKQDRPSLVDVASITPGPYEIHWNMGDGDHHNIVRADDPNIGRIASVDAFAPTDGDMEAEGIANALLFKHAPQTAAERDRLAQEVERLSDVKGALSDVLDALDRVGPANPFHDPILPEREAGRVALAKAEEQS